MMCTANNNDICLIMGHSNGEGELAGMEGDEGNDADDEEDEDARYGGCQRGCTRENLMVLYLPNQPNMAATSTAALSCSCTNLWVLLCSP